LLGHENFLALRSSAINGWSAAISVMRSGRKR
jgi:hypothetical protein